MLEHKYNFTNDMKQPNFSSNLISSHWLLVSWLTIFLVGTDLFVISPFLPLIGKELHTQPESLTILVTSFSLTYAIACPIQGRVAERWGLRRLLLVGVISLALANLFTAIAINLSQLILSRILAAVAAASISPTIYALTAERVEPAQRASHLAMVNSGLVISLALGAPLGLLIGDMTNWRTVFSGLAICLLVIAPMNKAVWLDETVSSSPKQTPTQENLWNAWPYLVCMLAWSCSIYAMYTLLGTALDRDFGASAQDTAIAMACFGTGATSGVILGGRLADQIGAKRLVQLSFLLMLISFFIFYFVYQQHSYMVLLANLFVVAFVAYGFFPAIQACAAQIFSIRRPTVLGLMSSALYVGISLGASIATQVFNAFGMDSVFLVSALAAFIGWIGSNMIKLNFLKSN
jgi:DHA1 family purine base/nucleoside efflux pump-like MFS transporter